MPPASPSPLEPLSLPHLPGARGNSLGDSPRESANPGIPMEGRFRHLVPVLRDLLALTLPATGDVGRANHVAQAPELEIPNVNASGRGPRNTTFSGCVLLANPGRL